MFSFAWYPLHDLQMDNIGKATKVQGVRKSPVPPIFWLELLNGTVGRERKVGKIAVYEIRQFCVLKMQNNRHI